MTFATRHPNLVTGLLIAFAILVGFGSGYVLG